ncbi:MAG: radical SAM protein [Candidatus Edwardsbacteria bacterium]|nr:radical SAM protein [Candidatus Edwardsbacteria bacterium]
MRGSFLNSLASCIDGPAVPFPNSIVYDLTLGCNLQCRMCLYQGRRAPERPFAELIPGFEKIIDRIKSVYIIGAEPMTRDDLPGTVAWFKQQGKRVTVQSNGTILREDVIAAVDRFDTSLDGLEQANDAIRGHGSFARTVKAIGCALDNGTMGTVSTVAMEENLSDIEPLASYLKQLDIAGIDLSPVVRYSTQEIAQMAVLGFAPDELTMPQGTYAAGFRDGFDRLTRRLRAFPQVTLRPAFLARDSGPFFNGLGKRCQSCGTIYSLRVGPAGELFHCGMIRRPFGNILDDDPVALWRGPMLAFRKQLYKYRLYPICYKCCKRSWVF